MGFISSLLKGISSNDSGYEDEYTCMGCGASYTFDEAAKKFNEYFDDEYDYSMDGWENYCADCAISGQEHAMLSGDAEGIPVGCSACGGDWPNCTTSCPMYDD